MSENENIDQPDQPEEQPEQQPEQQPEPESQESPCGHDHSNDDWTQDFYGNDPERPDHEDYPKLHEVLLRMDSTLVHGAPEEEAEAAWLAMCEQVGINREVLAHHVVIRTMTKMGLNPQDPAHRMVYGQHIQQAAAAWLDGFTAGALYKIKTGQDEILAAQEEYRAFQAARIEDDWRLAEAVDAHIKDGETPLDTAVRLIAELTA